MACSAPGSAARSMPGAPDGAASTTYHTARVTSVERGRSSGALSITAPVSVSLRW